MPIGWDMGYPRISRQELDRRAAWVKHYMAKGCSEWKARICAGRKHRTWPPKECQRQLSEKREAARLARFAS